MEAEILALMLRRVSTPEGADFFNQPIHSVIRPDVLPWSTWGERRSEIADASKKINFAGLENHLPPPDVLGMTKTLRVEKGSDLWNELAAVFEMDHGEYKIRMVEFTAEGKIDKETKAQSLDRWHANMEVYDTSGEMVGYVERALHRGNIKNVDFSLAPQVRNQKLATTYNRHLENWYIANGVSGVNLTATKEVGGYAWSRAGYDWDRSHYHWAVSRNEYLRSHEPKAALTIDNPVLEILDRVATADPAVIAAVLKLRARALAGIDAPEYPAPLEVSMIGYTDGASTWPGKEALLGSSWYAYKKLEPPK